MLPYTNVALLIQSLVMKTYCFVRMSSYTSTDLVHISLGMYGTGQSVADRLSSLFYLSVISSP